MLHSPSSSRTNIDANFAPTRWCYHHWHAPGQQQELGRGCGEGVWCIGWSRLDGDGWICGWTLCADVVCLQDISYDKFLKIIRKIEKDSKIQLIATSRHKFFFKAITVISTSSSNPITNHPHHPPRRLRGDPSALLFPPLRGRREATGAALAFRRVAGGFAGRIAAWFTDGGQRWSLLFVGWVAVNKN